jgi:peroxidase
MKIRKCLVGLFCGLALAGCGDGGNEFVATPSSPPGTVSFRTIDGNGNSPLDGGRAGSLFLRHSPVAYADGISAPAGGARQSARVVSNLVASQTNNMPDSGNRTDFLWVWGQFIDHDISLTLVGDEPFPVSVPTGDLFFDPFNTGVQELLFDRSDAASGTGTGVDNPRGFQNMLTAFLDGSVVYGSDQVRADALRTFSDGYLKTSEGDFPPYNTGDLPVDTVGPQEPTSVFLCGDVRANENVGLLSLHTLFVREHNLWATRLAVENPDWTDEQLYQMARKIVGAEIQVITYNFFLPAILGEDALPPYQGYDSGIDPGIDLMFSTAAYRIGHTMVGPSLSRLDANGQTIPEGNLALRDGFFRPERLVTEGGPNPIFRGLANSRMQSVDTRVIDDLRNFLFGPPGSGGLDLLSLNIQRGRDHGLADYNTVREAYGLNRVTQFSDITSDPTQQIALATAFPNVNDIDPWVGFLSEDHLPGSVTGPTLRAILVDQFTRLRDGDKYFYLNDPALNGYRSYLEQLTLSQIILENTGVQLQDNVFFLEP